jgi:hypothetical protein
MLSIPEVEESALFRDMMLVLPGLRLLPSLLESAPVPEELHICTLRQPGNLLN